VVSSRIASTRCSEADSSEFTVRRDEVLRFDFSSTPDCGASLAGGSGIGTCCVCPGTVGGVGSNGVGSAGVSSIGVGSIGVGSIGVGSIGVGAVGVGAVGAGSIGAGSIGAGSIGAGSLGGLTGAESCSATSITSKISGQPIQPSGHGCQQVA
jgi:hypothetical protein